MFDADRISLADCNLRVRSFFVAGSWLRRVGASVSQTLFACVVTSGFTVVQARAQGADDFYAGKILKLYVSAVAGGGYDNIARAFLRHFTKHLPGQPTGQVLNMVGGGGVVMANWAYNVAPRDGTMIGMPNLSMVMDQIVMPGTVRFNASSFNWIGNIEPQTMSVFTWHGSTTKTIEDARRRETVMAASTKGSPLQQTLSLANLTLGTKFKIVMGYNETRVMAIERGEVEGSASSVQNFAVLAPHWLEAKPSLINILAINAKGPLQKFPDVPTMLELTTDPKHKAMLEFMMLQSLTGRAIFAPPEVPTARVQALRAAFDATIASGAFIEDMKRLKVEVEPTSGRDLADSIVKVLNASPETAALVLKAIE